MNNAIQAPTPAVYFYLCHIEHPLVPVSPEFDTEEAAEQWRTEHGVESLRIAKAGFR